MPFSKDALAAQQVQEHLKALYQLVHEIEKKRHASEQGINNIVKYQNSQDEKSTQHHQAKTKNLCKAALTLSENEEESIRRALQRIADIRQIKNERRIQTRMSFSKETIIRQGAWMNMLLCSAQSLPLFVGRRDERAPPLCGAVPAEPGYVARVGDMVAAHVNIPEGDKENWILAEVVSFNHSTNKYEVEDIHVEQNQEGRHILGKRDVMPLPLMRANPETDPDALFPPRAVVKALYPSTSCLYEGIVHKSPSTHTEDYEIIFEDMTRPGGRSPPFSVPQRYVIALKQKSKQN